MKRRRSQRGYALLDAVVALGIVGIISAMFVHVVHGTILSRRHVETSRKAALIAQSRLAELREGAVATGTGREGGYIWQSAVAPFPGAPDGPGIERLTVTVREAANGRSVLVIETLRLAR